ncbi:hypothetical protein [Elizabethkingia miricola]|uniref:hypothetical protein n=1 Tax=Elizabethkingia miricola TaxID=172045 RepID=UPI003892ABF3
MKTKKLKILVGCEYSATVRSAFEQYGHDVVSCDLLPSEKPGKHFIGDLGEKLQEKWDAIIAFPPCTYLSSAGLYLCNVENRGISAWERIQKRNEAVDFFLSIWFADCEHICIENPLGFISSTILKPTQIIHPYYFGDTKMKRTALWLKNLPSLVHAATPTLFDEVSHHQDKSDFYIGKTVRKSGKIKNKTWIDVANQHERSRFSQNIAEAMAKQWTDSMCLS